MNLTNHSDASFTKNEILTKLFSSKEIDQMLKKHDGGAGNEDLKSELFFVLCNCDDQKIKDLHDKNQLLYYSTGIVQRMIFQKGSKFFRTYRKTSTEFNDAIDVPLETYDFERDKKETDTISKIDELHWVESAMMRIYVKEKSLANACKKTGISYRQGTKIMTNARHKLNTSVNGKIMGNYLVADIQIVLDVSKNVTPESALDLMDEFQEFLNYKLSGQTIPSKTEQGAFVKEVKPAKIKRII